MFAGWHLQVESLENVLVGWEGISSVVIISCFVPLSPGLIPGSRFPWK